MLKGLSITPPTVGRISIGRIVEKNGKRLPQKDDQFTITSQVQMGEGWVLHPLDEKLRKAAGGKLREIPVRLLFNDPGLNLRAAYSLFDRETGRPVCVGNGETCRRTTKAGTEVLPCPGPDACVFAKGIDRGEFQRIYQPSNRSWSNSLPGPLGVFRSLCSGRPITKRQAATPPARRRRHRVFLKFVRAIVVGHPSRSSFALFRAGLAG